MNKNNNNEYKTIHRHIDKINSIMAMNKGNQTKNTNCQDFWWLWKFVTDPIELPKRNKNLLYNVLDYFKYQ